MNHFRGYVPHLPIGKDDASEIRVVKLYLDSWNAPVRCELKHVSLQYPRAEETTGYGAVSYVWGNPADNVDVLLNGVQFPVTANLFSVLKNIRQVFRDMTIHDTASSESTEPTISIDLWIDAICINQSDLDERALQVTRMADIYAKATSVIAYVGDIESEDKDNTEIIFKYSEEMDNEDALEALHKALYKDSPVGKMSCLGNTILDALKAFYDRPFFQRIWTVQEIVIQFSNTAVMCGTRVTRMDQLTALSQLMVLIDSQRGVYDERLSVFWMSVLPCVTLAKELRVNQLASGSDIAQRLYRLLRATWNHQATEERDKLYGVLGLLGTNVPPELRPSYEIPLEEVYHGYVKWLLEHTNDLRLLEGCRFYPTVVPSWVNDLTRAGDPEEMTKLLYRENTEAGPRDAVRFSNNGRTLHVRGTRIGPVVAILRAIYSNEVANDEVLSWLDSFESQIVQKLCELKPDCDRTEVLNQIVASLRPGHVNAIQAFEDAIARKTLTNVGSQSYFTSSLTGLWSANWMLLDDGSIWHAQRECYVPRKDDIIYYLKGSAYATLIRHDANADKTIRVTACNHFQKLKKLRQLSLEEWSSMNVEEIEIS